MEEQAESVALGRGAGKSECLSTGMAVLFAVAAGLAVGNLYWAQPLLAQIAGGFGMPASQGGFLVTATQIGYALGILLIVPLGDAVHRRKLICAVTALSVVMLLACALAPSFSFLAVALSGLGLVTVSGQIILPLAGDLAQPSERGRIIGIVTSGITTGILFSRFASGVVANVWGWRTVYVVAAMLNLCMMIALSRKVPEAPKDACPSYGRLIASVFTSLKRFPVLPPMLIMNGLVFGIAFNLFWTALTFLLSGEPYRFDTFQIGLVSLAGVTGAFAAVGCGRLQDAGRGIPALGASISLCILSMAVAAVSGGSVIALVVIAAVFSLAIQGVCILSQSRIFALSDTERSRLNAAFVVSNFLFGAVGSGLTTLIWNEGGWTAVALGAAGCCAVALGVWAFSKKSLPLSRP